MSVSSSFSSADDTFNLFRSTPNVFKLCYFYFCTILGYIDSFGLSRTREFEADRVASELSGDPKGLAMALKKLDSQKFNWWNYYLITVSIIKNLNLPNYLKTHPPSGIE